MFWHLIDVEKLPVVGLKCGLKNPQKYVGLNILSIHEAVLGPVAILCKQKELVSGRLFENYAKWKKLLLLSNVYSSPKIIIIKVSTLMHCNRKVGAVSVLIFFSFLCFLCFHCRLIFSVLLHVFSSKKVNKLFLLHVYRLTTSHFFFEHPRSKHFSCLTYCKGWQKLLLSTWTEHGTAFFRQWAVQNFFKDRPFFLRIFWMKSFCLVKSWETEGMKQNLLATKITQGDLIHYSWNSAPKLQSLFFSSISCEIKGLHFNLALLSEVGHDSVLFHL